MYVDGDDADEVRGLRLTEVVVATMLGMLRNSDCLTAWSSWK
jgi:hypothetical protein